MSRGVEIGGLAELDKKLASLPEVVRAAARAAIKDETDDVADDMRRFAPVKTGELRRSIKSRVRAGKKLEGRAVAKARHATFVNDGTSSTPAQPFREPAAEISRKRFPKRLRAVLGRHVKKLTK